MLKGLAIGLGFVATLLSLMAVVGLLTENGWIRVLVALLVALAVPAILSDRLLPDDVERARGHWREAKVVTSTAPEQSPIDARVIAALARGGSAVSAPAPGSGPKPALIAKPVGALLVHEQRGATLDQEQLLATLALSAGVFTTAPLRLSVFTRGAADEKAATALIRRAAERFELAPGRVTAARSAPAPGVAARLEVLALP